MNKFQKVLKWVIRFVTLFIPCIWQGVMRMKNDRIDEQEVSSSNTIDSENETI